MWIISRTVLISTKPLLCRLPSVPLLSPSCTFLCEMLRAAEDYCSVLTASQNLCLRSTARLLAGSYVSTTEYFIHIIILMPLRFPSFVLLGPFWVQMLQLQKTNSAQRGLQFLDSVNRFNLEPQSSPAACRAATGLINIS